VLSWLHLQMANEVTKRMLKRHRTQSTQSPQSCFLERFSAISADSALIVRFFSKLLVVLGG
jgi:hypothetical protein